MKITKSRLKQIIKEEVSRAVKRGHVLREGTIEAPEGMGHAEAARVYQDLQSPKRRERVREEHPVLYALATNPETADDLFNMLQKITVDAVAGPHKSYKDRRAAEDSAEITLGPGQ